MDKKRENKLVQSYTKEEREEIGKFIDRSIENYFNNLNAAIDADIKRYGSQRQLVA